MNHRSPDYQIAKRSAMHTKINVIHFLCFSAMASVSLLVSSSLEFVARAYILGVCFLHNSGSWQCLWKELLSVGLCLCGQPRHAPGDGASLERGGGGRWGSPRTRRGRLECGTGVNSPPGQHVSLTLV